MSATSHIKYLLLSREFYISYKAIVSSFPQIVDKFHVKYTLVCKSIEYLLKSLLLFGGKSERELKNEYGHDLEKLLTAVIDAGFDKQLDVNFTHEFKSVLLSIQAYKNRKNQKKDKQNNSQRCKLRRILHVEFYCSRITIET